MTKLHMERSLIRACTHCYQAHCANQIVCSASAIPYIEISIHSKMLYIIGPSTTKFIPNLGHGELVSFVMLSAHVGIIIGLSFHGTHSFNYYITNT